MATYFALQQVGVADGTKIPSLKLDGRQVGVARQVIVATKDNTNALVAADKIYLGKLRQGEQLLDIEMLTDTSWATTTISIGTLTTPAKYVNADTFTTVNRRGKLALLASVVAAGPLTADEDIYATIAVAGVAAAVVSHFFLEKVNIH